MRVSFAGLGSLTRLVKRLARRGGGAQVGGNTFKGTIDSVSDVYFLLFKLNPLCESASLREAEKGRVSARS